MDNKVRITRDQLEELVRDSLELESLQAAGVDNWQGYEESEIVSGQSVQEKIDYILGE